jgi:hypothetical protein
MFIRFEENKTVFIRLFRIEANQRILHANILFILLQSKYFEAK